MTRTAPAAPPHVSNPLAHLPCAPQRSSGSPQLPSVHPTGASRRQHPTPPRIARAGGPTVRHVVPPPPPRGRGVASPTSNVPELKAEESCRRGKAIRMRMQHPSPPTRPLLTHPHPTRHTATTMLLRKETRRQPGAPNKQQQTRRVSSAVAVLLLLLFTTTTTTTTTHVRTYGRPYPPPRTHDRLMHPPCPRSRHGCSLVRRRRPPAAGRRPFIQQPKAHHHTPRWPPEEYTSNSPPPSCTPLSTTQQTHTPQGNNRRRRKRKKHPSSS